MIIGIIILIFLAMVYLALPLWVKLIVLIINSFTPDAIPILDEIFMITSAIEDLFRISKIMSIIEWICSHKVLVICIILSIIVYMTVISTVPQ